MTLKQYGVARIIITALLAALISQAVIINNYYLATAAILIAIGLMLFMKRRVKEVIADERDYEIAGKAARWSIAIFSIAGSVIVLVSMALRQYNPALETIGSIIAYSICLLLLLNSLIFGYMSKSLSFKSKVLYYIVAVVLALFFTIAGLRLFSGEDDWLCANGQWIKHGNPSATMPTTECRVNK